MCRVNFYAVAKRWSSSNDKKKYPFISKIPTAFSIITSTFTCENLSSFLSYLFFKIGKKIILYIKTIEHV